MASNCMAMVKKEGRKEEKKGGARYSEWGGGAESLQYTVRERSKPVENSTLQCFFL